MDHVSRKKCEVDVKQLHIHGCEILVECSKRTE